LNPLHCNLDEQSAVEHGVLPQGWRKFRLQLPG